MFESKDQELIREFHEKSGHCESSMKSYNTVFRKYCSFHDMCLFELLTEAIAEQEMGVPENQLSIYNRIISFRNFLAENHVGSTVSNSISKIKTFYQYNRVYLPFIPPLNPKTIRKNDVISFEDLPTKDELKLVLEFADDNLSLWIMVMISSGMTRSEAKSMTNEMFFKGTYEYHKKGDFEDAMKCLVQKNNAICTCKLVRQKTDKPFYTFLSPECVQKIAKVKLKQKDFNLNEPLLKYELNHVNHKFKKLNDYLGFGEVGGFTRFRPHMLRKFHATYLNQGSLGKTSLNKDDIDLLHGRGNQTREAYFKDNPLFLKLEYVKSMNNISLYHYYGWKIINDEIKVRAIRL